MFARHGYDRATVRQIAGAAHVDPAMVHYFFGSKAQLFVVAMEFPVNPIAKISEALSAHPTEVGEQIVRHFIDTWDVAPSAEPMIALMRSVDDDRSVAMFAEYIRREITTQFAGAATGSDAELRAEFISAQIIGLAFTRYVLKLEPLATATSATIAAWVGPSINRYLTGEDPTPGTSHGTHVT